MIKIEKTNVFGWEAAIRGMRNAFNSWDKSDTNYIAFSMKNDLVMAEPVIGDNDLKLMKSLSKAGNDHGKYLRMVNVTTDVTAPLFWWKEFDTYKVGTVCNSCSTMHTIQSKEFSIEDFSHEHLAETADFEYEYDFLNCLKITIDHLNEARRLYLLTKDKKWWWQMIELLPTSYNQKRTIQLNYQVLKLQYYARRNHKLDDWHTYCDWILTLPHFKELCVEDIDK